MENGPSSEHFSKQHLSFIHHQKSLDSAVGFVEFIFETTKVRLQAESEKYFQDYKDVSLL